MGVFTPPSAVDMGNVYNTIRAGMFEAYIYTLSSGQGYPGCSHHQGRDNEGIHITIGVGLSERIYLTIKVGVSRGIYTTIGTRIWGCSHHPACCLPAHYLSPFLPLEAETRSSRAISA